MLKSQSIQIRQSEIRGRLNELLDKDELTEDERAERDRLTAEFKDSEPNLRAALVSETGPDAEAADEPDADVVDAVQLRDYFAAGMGGELTGAARELNAGLDLDARPLSGGVWIPPQALMSDDLQERADTTTGAPTAVGGSQAGILGRLFSDGRRGSPGLHVSDRRTGHGDLSGNHRRQRRSGSQQGRDRGRRRRDHQRRIVEADPDRNPVRGQSRIAVGTVGNANRTGRRFAQRHARQAGCAGDQWAGGFAGH